MKLKGKTTIELTDVNTGELTTVEQENMLTNVLPNFFNHNPMGLFNSMSNARTLKYFNKHFLPICPNLLGGILLFSGTLEEDAGNILVGSSQLPMAYASNNANPYDDTKRGSMNLNETMVIENGYKFVWDFSTSQGNGTIAALALTSCHGGAAVYGNTYDDTSPFFLMKQDDISGHASEIRILCCQAVEVDIENEIMYSMKYTTEGIYIYKVHIPIHAIGLTDNLDGSTYEILEERVILPSTFQFVDYINLNGAFYDGKDLIITKSISRFARNTVTVLKVARELKELGVGIFFEEQNINTLSGDGEMMLAVLSSFAQEESRSDYGDMVVDRKEALVVEFIFDMYLFYVGGSRLADLLNFLGVKTVTGTIWESGTIKGMLCNEKYKGDFHMQKYFTPEHMRGQTRLNRGEVKSYYISENHEPIIAPEKWEQVQRLRERRKQDRNIGQDNTEKFKNRYPLSGLLICPYCGKTLRRRQEYNKKIRWICSTYIEKGIQTCRGIRIDDKEVAGRGITEPTVVEEVEKNGKKHYRYTRKTDFNRGGAVLAAGQEAADGSVLQGINRPRRTAIKL